MNMPPPLYFQNTKSYFICRERVIEGPFSLSDIQIMLEQENIDPHVLVCQANDTNWIPLCKKVKISGIRSSTSVFFRRVSIILIAGLLIGVGYHYRTKLGWEGNIRSYSEAITTVEHIKSNAAFTHLKDKKMKAVDALHTGLQQISQGGNINDTYENGATALHNAAFIADRKMMQFLLNQGAKIRSIDRDGKIPLMYAAEAGNKDNFDFLIELGANIKSRDSLGWSSLMAAAEGGNLEIVKYLVEQQVPIDAVCRGETPLKCAQREKHTEVIKYLESRNK